MDQELGHAARWWTYQRERFPLHAHVPLVAAFSTAAVGYSALLRGAADRLGWATMGSAFASGLLFFFLLRVADEFKDYEQDRRYRPRRPVPRGLVSLRELGLAGAAAAAVQLAVTLAIDAVSLLPLFAAWAYFALMSAEFFVPRWLRRRPGADLLSHGLVVPLVALHLTAFDWMAAGAPWPAGLGWFLAASFFGGLTFEIGRKLRAPEDEAAGVETYTAAWGRTAAIAAWLGALGLAGACTAAAAAQTGCLLPALVVLGLLLLAAAGASVLFLRRPVPGRARTFEPIAGLYVLGQYVALGAAPLLT